MEYWFINSKENITGNNSERGYGYCQLIVSKESETGHCTIEILSLVYDFVYRYNVFKCCLIFQIYVNNVDWIHAFPMKSKGQAHNTLGLLFHCEGNSS
jgi:hypothetical protein